MDGDGQSILHLRGQFTRDFSKELPVVWNSAVRDRDADQFKTEVFAAPSLLLEFKLVVLGISQQRSHYIETVISKDPNVSG